MATDDVLDTIVGGVHFPPREFGNDSCDHHTGRDAQQRQIRLVERTLHVVAGKTRNCREPAAKDDQRIPPTVQQCLEHDSRRRAEGKGLVLDQFANPDNPLSHYEGTGPEIWRDTDGGITHFVSSMGTTGTSMGVSQFLKEKNPDIQIVGVQPAGEDSIPGIRRWPEAYLPKIFDRARVDQIIDITQEEAEDMTRRLAAEEGIFAGISSGGALSAALRLSQDVEDAVIVTIICDRGDRYLSTNVFPA